MSNTTSLKQRKSITVDYTKNKNELNTRITLDTDVFYPHPRICTFYIVSLRTL